MEELGFASVWAFDTVGRGFMVHEPLTALAVAAGATTTVGLGVGVLQLPLRSTVDVAHRALTLHHVSGGRFVLGVGPGSNRQDFDAAGVPFVERFDRFDRELPRLLELLRTGRSGDVDLTSWPEVGEGPPVVLAGWRGGWIERAAQLGVGWLASAANADDDTLADGIDRFRSAGGQHALVTNLRLGRELEPDLERVRGMGRLGFDDAIVLVMRPTDERLAAVAEALVTS
jgi:alkanesulfonate monooxygenase SsuD/methylene tetrahydromethanopterin reductase-like flavin-dependent oxidoreductase (luciferase family)